VDITGRKRAEDALKASEARFRALADNISQFAWMTDEKGWIFWYNQRWYDYTGTNLEQMKGWGWQQVHHPDHVQRVTERFRHHLESGEVWEDTFPLRGKDGHYRWFLSRAVPIRDEHGKVIRWFGTNTDITELRQAQRSQATLAAIVESSADAIISQSLDGHILSWNAGAQRLFGYTAEEAVGRPVSMLIPEPQIPLVPEHLAELEAGQTLRRFAVERVRKDGSRIFVSLSISPIKDADGHLVAVAKIAHDVTDLKSAQVDLQAAMQSAEAAKAAAEQANKAKDHFLAVLSHELRTPLTPVVAAVSMLQQQWRCDEASREMLEMVRRNVELEARLIDDLLDATRITRGKIELDCQPVQLCEVIRRAVDICRPDIEARRLHFGVDIGPEAPYAINADPARLQQVFWNLIKNAIKFTPPGGCVGIRCRRDRDGHVVAEVNDSGKGIEPSLLPHIFKPFEQGGNGVTRQFGGLGLGLTITKGLVEMHGGSIEAHSEGKGATFRVRLPLIGPATAVAGSPRTPPEETGKQEQHGDSLHILVVEDHADTARIMRRLLTREGHNVEVAGDVATALQLAGMRHFDLLISDLGLPDGSGLDLIRALRQRQQQLPAIALSGYGQEQDIRSTREAGFAAHLTKPVNLDRLSLTIATVVNRSTPHRRAGHRG